MHRHVIVTSHFFLFSLSSTSHSTTLQPPHLSLQYIIFAQQRASLRFTLTLSFITLHVGLSTQNTMWSPKPKRKKGASRMEAMEADATFDQTTPVAVASATTTPGGKTIVLDSEDKNRPSHETWKHKQDHTAGAGSHQEEAAPSGRTC